jgi:hypothetical protein
LRLSVTENIFFPCIFIINVVVTHTLRALSFGLALGPKIPGPALTSLTHMAGAAEISFHFCVCELFLDLLPISRLIIIAQQSNKCVLVWVRVESILAVFFSHSRFSSACFFLSIFEFLLCFFSISNLIESCRYLVSVCVFFF